MDSPSDADVRSAKERVTWRGQHKSGVAVGQRQRDDRRVKRELGALPAARNCSICGLDVKTGPTPRSGTDKLRIHRRRAVHASNGQHQPEYQSFRMTSHRSPGSCHS
jgi:hypothetical protein